MRTELAIDLLATTLGELHIKYRDRFPTLREALESMNEEELRHWLIKVIYASNRVVQSRL